MKNRTAKENIIRLYEADRADDLHIEYALDAINFFWFDCQDDDNAFSLNPDEDDYIFASEYLFNSCDFTASMSTSEYMDLVVDFADAMKDNSNKMAYKKLYGYETI